MIIGYIKEEQSHNKLFKGIEIKKYHNNYIIMIHNKHKKKTIRKLIKISKKLKIEAMVFSKELEGNFKQDVLSMLKDSRMEILNGKYLMRLMQFDIVKYVLNKQNNNMRQEDIYVVFKKDEKLNLDFLKQFIENFRMVNIITNDVARFKNIQDNLLENDGILISVSNNKRKALKRAKYILNVNLSKGELEKYKINRDAIIINIQENVKYDDSNFDGINVNYFEIKVPDELQEKFEKIGGNFDDAILYESMLLSENIQKKKIEGAIERISKDDISITSLIGNNGIIRDEELVKINKMNLDKMRKLV